MEQADDQYPEKPVEMRQLPITPGKVPGAPGGDGGGGGFRTSEPNVISFHAVSPADHHRYLYRSRTGIISSCDGRRR
jgi:hypothetical protein